MLFFTMSVNNELSIYKKENPLAPAQVQITSGSNCAFPTYCSATDRVTFSKQMNGLYYDIYMMPVGKGNALIPVTETNRNSEYVPSFSPDGKYLAYQKGGTTDGEIWIKDLTSGENMLLGKGIDPSISPAGKKIVYGKVESGNTSNIWVMEVDGSNAQQITTSKEEYSAFPKWSPSGRKIVFQSNKKKSNFDIFVMNADGTGLMQFTTRESSDIQSFWSQNGCIYIIRPRRSERQL